MIIKYDVLFEVEVRHTYYTEACALDFDIEPTPECAELLGRLGFVIRRSNCGFKIFVQVVPETNPAQLANPPGDGSLKFSFMMSLRNSYFGNISEIADYKPSYQIFYFSNLNEDIEDDRSYLGDHMDGARVGNPVNFIKTEVINYKFANPVNAAAFTLEDIFGNNYQLEKAEFSFSNPSDETTSFQHNLGAVPGMKSGRYLLADNQAGSLPFYYNPPLYGKNVFGIIEIFTNTNDFTNPSNNLVPETYRFIENDALSGKGNYTVGFEASQIKWMYVCRKNKDNTGNGISVDNLTVEGPVVFSKSGGDDIEERRILSDDPIVASDQLVNVILKHNGIKIRDLPKPAMGSALKTDNNEIYYEMYIYV